PRDRPLPAVSAACVISGWRRGLLPRRPALVHRHGRPGEGEERDHERRLAVEAHLRRGFFRAPRRAEEARGEAATNASYTSRSADRCRAVSRGSWAIASITALSSGSSPGGV